MHHNFGLTPFPLTSTRTKRRSTRVSQQAQPSTAPLVTSSEVSRTETPVAGSTATSTDQTAEEGAE